SPLALIDPLPLDQIKTASRELLPRARSLAQDYRNDFARIPELSAWLKDREETQLSELTQAPIVLIGNATEADVIACFHQQLKANLIALGGLAAGDPSFREW